MDNYHYSYGFDDFGDFGSGAAVGAAVAGVLVILLVILLPLPSNVRVSVSGTLHHGKRQGIKCCMALHGFPSATLDHGQAGRPVLTITKG